MKIKLLLLVFIFSATISYGQDTRRKLGKPSAEELNMTVFAADSTAAAVILSQYTNIYYEIPESMVNAGQFYLIHEYEVRIKVLKPEGAELANIVIPYYEVGESKDKVRIINATAYNLEGGKTVKSELSRKDIFDEMAAKNVRLKKFSIPNVRAGTVIEYKYSITSEFLHNIRDVELQGNYPILITAGEIQIPRIFRYHINTTGYERMEVERKGSNIHVPSVYDGVINSDAETIKYSMKNVPALKNEPHVWYPDDFRSKITIEISRLYIAGIVSQDYSSSWSVIDNQLGQGEFGRNLKISCPFADEVKQLAGQTENKSELLRAILKLVTSKIKWDKTCRLLCENVRRDLREGSGSSAAVNFILNSALREAGFKTTPILLNPRHMGRMPLSHPSLTNINAFVIAVHLDNENVVVMDATDQDNEVNVLPPQFMVDKAKFYGSGNGGWMDLSGVGDNSTVIDLTCEFDDDMALVTKVNSIRSDLHSMLAKKRYRSAASEEEYIEELEAEHGIEISDYSIGDLSQKEIVESYKFRKAAGGAGDFIYVNATVLPFMSKSIFTQQERKLPVEFPYMENHEIHCRIKIPDGYRVEELPKGGRITIPDSGIVYIYSATEEEGEIVCTMNYSVNRILYSVDEYPMIFEIYGHIVSRSNANIVLKKI